MTRCYLDEVEAYQMRLKWNRELLCGEPKNAFLPFPLTQNCGCWRRRFVSLEVLCDMIYDSVGDMIDG